MNDRENMHQLHTNVPQETYDELRTILPERGMITSMVRSFLRRYVNKVRKLQSQGIIKDPFDGVIDEIIEDQIKKGVFDGEEGEGNAS